MVHVCIYGMELVKRREGERERERERERGRERFMGWHSSSCGRACVLYSDRTQVEMMDISFMLLASMDGAISDMATE